jgi:hypothetical protein
MPELATRQIEAIARLRLLVAVLGGAAHARWWRTEFLTPAGLRFLERLYPRTSHLAALRATGVAARALHDSNIGRGEVYHLFRLPGPLEVELQSLAGSGFLGQAVRDLAPSLDSKDALLTQVDALSPDLTESGPGPQRIGTVRDLRRGSLLGRWVGAYRHAFRQERAP